MNIILLELDKLYGRYKYLQNLYYEMYTEAYISPICPTPESGWGNLSPSNWVSLECCGSKSLRKRDGDGWRYIKLYIDFKCVCRLLNKIKTLLEYTLSRRASLHPDRGVKDPSMMMRVAHPNGEGYPESTTNVLLGFEEINTLLSYKDIKTFFDNNDILYSIIDSNYDLDLAEN
jgi:hypothetical protein